MNALTSEIRHLFHVLVDCKIWDHKNMILLSKGNISFPIVACTVGYIECHHFTGPGIWIIITGGAVCSTSSMAPKFCSFKSRVFFTMHLASPGICTCAHIYGDDY